MKKRKLLSLLLAGAIAFSFAGCFDTGTNEPNNSVGGTNTGNTENGGNTGGTNEPSRPVEGNYDKRGLDAIEYAVLNLTGTDAVGRKVKIAESEKSGTQEVGLFYSLWLGQHQYMQQDVYDVQALLATTTGKNALYSQTDSALSREGEFHFCSQPLYGYYNMQDPWVITRHIELLTMAGIDYLCFDATNASIYPEVGKKVLNTLLKYQRQGWDVPKAMFYTNSKSGSTVEKIYNQYYKTDTYNDIWYAPEGKPRIIGVTRNSNNASDQTKYDPSFNDYISTDMLEFFDVKESQWPNGNHNDNAIPWMSWSYPQLLHANTKSVSVSVAQHSPTRISFSYQDPQSSRGYDYKTGKVRSDYEKGQNFQNEWDTVFQYGSQVENVLVTGWNEWMAVKSFDGSGALTLVDVFNEEYSRDIEMTTGKYGDNFYMQLVENVRKYKLSDGIGYDLKKTNINIQSQSSIVLWDYVTAKYKDFEGDAMARNFEDAVGKKTYVDNSNRNDIAEVRVTHDNSNVYFYIRTVDDVTAYNGKDKNWMNVLISTGGENGFGDYDYIINRSPSADGTTSVEKSIGGYNWQSAGTAKYTIVGNVMQISIPFASLGLSASNHSFSFKVSDNVTKYDDIMDYYVSGDSAPIGRLSFRYGAAV